MGSAGLVLTGLTTLLGLVGLLLAVPVGLQFHLRGMQRFDGRLAIRWLFGLVRLEFRWPRAAPPAKPQAAVRAGRHARRPKHRGRGGSVRGLRLLRDAAFRRRALRLAASLVRAAHPRRLSLRLRMGLGDPADTGRLWGLLGPVSAAARSLGDVDVRIEPEFADAVLDVDARGQASVVPLHVLVLVAAFALSPVTLAAWHHSRDTVGG